MNEWLIFLHTRRWDTYKARHDTRTSGERRRHEIGNIVNINLKIFADVSQLIRNSFPFRIVNSSRIAQFDSMECKWDWVPGQLSRTNRLTDKNPNEIHESVMACIDIWKQLYVPLTWLTLTFHTKPPLPHSELPRNGFIPNSNSIQPQTIVLFRLIRK